MDRKNLNPKKARSLAQKIFGRIKDKNERAFRILHAGSVAQSALMLSAKIKSLDREALIVSAWLHDIGYVEDKKNHAMKSLEILERDGYLVPNKIRDCILNHGSIAKPRTREGRIFQAADKISFLDTSLIAMMIRQNGERIRKNETDFLRKMLNSAVDLLEKLKIN